MLTLRQSKQKLKIMIFFVLISFFFIGCNISDEKVIQPTIQIVDTPSNINTPIIIETLVTPTLPSSPTPLDLVMETDDMITLTPTLYSPTVVSTPIPLTIKTCPSVVIQSSPIWAEGIILFSTGALQYDFPDSLNDPFSPFQSGIWGISNKALEPYLYYSIREPQPSWILLNQTGTKFAQRQYPNLEEDLENILIVDLITNEENFIPITSAPKIKSSWTPQGQVEYLLMEEPVYGEGIQKELLLIDPATQTVETHSKYLNLPQYIFDTNDKDKGIVTGYAKKSPVYDIILYTSRGNNNIQIVLFDLRTQQIIKQIRSQVIPNIIEPIWNEAGTEVTFATYNDSYVEIKRWDIEGKEQSLPTQPYPITNASTVDYLSVSPTGQYILYTTSQHNSEIQGYIVDTIKFQAQPLCLSDEKFLDGKWITDNLFIYRTAMTDRHILNILDITNGTKQIVFTSPDGFGINFFGVTTIDMSEN